MPLSTSIATVTSGGVVATDTGDGGISLASVPVSKMTKYTYGESTYFKIANAIALATANPQPPGVPTAGTAGTASRGDHVHGPPPVKPYAIRIFSGSQVPMARPGGPMTAFAVNRAHFSPIYVVQNSRAPIVISKASINVTTAAGAGGVVRIALWKSDASGGWDFTQKVFESGAISTTSTGMKDYVVSATLPEGIYWQSYVPQVSNCSVMGYNNSDSGLQTQGGNPGQMADYWYQDGISGAYPGFPSPNVGGDGAFALFFTFA
jgi:hypothetical protein